ncbi:2,3-bisphosphoglycerate-independent phosphoglycerate mutase [Gossypium australe]|uniref:2,3-bisphosphoglycerate-independent phosphoglycerate mutase n=1 Tax=Gossypium australe TaxID=47621 RepID=A0A5B6UYV5_9ROSI|nr:2,3-bisphosphoglycerate-independent phosphoglycerate mutase [Gossypium australe]
MDPSRVVADDAESNAPAPAQGAAPSESKNVSSPQDVELLLLNKPPVDKIQKYEAKEFRDTVDDDSERAKFWLEYTTRVFDELSCIPIEC